MKSGRVEFRAGFRCEVKNTCIILRINCSPQTHSLSNLPRLSLIIHTPQKKTLASVKKSLNTRTHDHILSVLTRDWIIDSEWEIAHTARADT